jgi:hypothetical protein
MKEAIKRKPASRRVAWPEPGRQNGGEFRLTWGRLAAIITILVGIAGAVPIFWTITDHWMNRQEIQTALKAHADHDAGVQAWNQYLFSSNRLEYLDDKKAECEAKQLANRALTPDEDVICKRYRDKYASKAQEAATLKADAMNATKEK